MPVFADQDCAVIDAVPDDVGSCGGGDDYDDSEDIGEDECQVDSQLSSNFVKGKSNEESNEKRSSNDIETKSQTERSRTPSPFLSTNRYYPEFYAKKEEREREEKLASRNKKL